MESVHQNSDSVDVDEIKDLLTCSLCSRTLNEPRILPCFHNFCKVCLGKYVERLRGGDKNIETFPCPTCRSEFTLKSNQDVADLTSSYFIQNMLEITAIQEKAQSSTSCSNCEDLAINHCASCQMFMCQKCSKWHDIWPGNKNHDVLSTQELEDPKRQEKMRRKLYCIEHEDEVLKYFCETCKELCCIHCMFSNHQKQNHSCMAVNEVAQKQKETLQSSCTTLDEKLSEGKKAFNNICEVMKFLEKNAKTAKDQIKEQKEKILKIVAEKLDEKAKKMNEDVDEVYGKLHSGLRKQHDEIKEYLDKVQASVSLPRNLLKRGSIEEILSSKKLIDKKIEKLEKEKPEKVDPVSNGGIQYVPDDIDKINVNEIVGHLGYVEGVKKEKICTQICSRNMGPQYRLPQPIEKPKDLDAINDGDIQYVPDDTDKSNVDEIVEKLGFVKGSDSETCKLKKSSSILKEEIAFIKQLQKWLGEKCKWNLCYRASRDGWSAQDFHRHCDNKGPTVVLVKANNYIFGGYADQHWESLKRCRFKRSNSSFLFSLRNEHNLAPFIANIKQGQQYAIICNSGYGPIFGEGYDLCICNNPQTNQTSYSNFGYTYQLPPGYVYNSERANNLLAGQYKFLTTEIEVFN